MDSSPRIIVGAHLCVRPVVAKVVHRTNRADTQVGPYIKNSGGIGSHIPLIKN
jgi:hypothetical protein